MEPPRFPGRFKPQSAETNASAGQQSPISKAQVLTPWWMMAVRAFDALEIHPCAEYVDANGTPFVEQCMPEEAAFWTVFGHYWNGGLDAFEDFPPKKMQGPFETDC